MSFIIRNAKREDSSLLLEFIKELALYEKMADQVVATEELLEQSIFTHGRAKALIGEVMGEPVAFAIYFYNYSTFQGQSGIYLEDLFVKPSHRGKSYGKAMLSHLAKIAVEEKCGRFEWSVLHWNKPAKDFYESLGASQKKEWEVYSISGEELKVLADH